MQGLTSLGKTGIIQTIYRLETGAYFGVRVYQNIFTGTELALLEDEVRRKLVSQNN